MNKKLMRILILFTFLFCILNLFIINIFRNRIFFKQERAGLNGKPFYIYKFKTMNDKTDNQGELLPGYQRITRIGNILRKTSLDELPQLINLIKGDIALVGPRPLHVEYNEYYNSEQVKRLDVKPGITGLAQVNGRNNISWDEKFKLDVEYVNNKSLLLDFKILVKTIVKVFSKADINPDDLKETPRFKGEEK